MPCRGSTALAHPYLVSSLVAGRNRCAIPLFPKIERKKRVLIRTARERVTRTFCGGWLFRCLNFLKELERAMGIEPTTRSLGIFLCTVSCLKSRAISCQLVQTRCRTIEKHAAITDQFPTTDC